MAQVFFNRTRFIPSAIFKMLSSLGFNAVDMHFHTEYSMDAVSDIRSVLAKCRKRSIGVAITDHNAVDGAVKAWKMKKSEFVIPGMEASTQEGSHALYFFDNINQCTQFYNKAVRKLAKKNPFFLPIGIDELMDKARDFNALIATSHPYGPGVTGIKKVNLRRGIEWAEKRFHFIEALNGVCLRDMNTRAIRWANFIKKGMTGGSDGHTTAELGNVLTLGYGYDPEEFLTSVRKRHSTLVGKEENLFSDAIHQIVKEKIYLQRAHERGLGGLWITEHAKEAKNLKQKVRKLGKNLPEPYDLLHNTNMAKRMEKRKYYIQLGKDLFR